LIVPVLFRLLCARAAARPRAPGGPGGPSERVQQPQPQPQPGAARRPSAARQANRANPSPEVTDLFCRIPLPTFPQSPEAIHLGDLMRLWVRPLEEPVAPPLFHGPSHTRQTPQACSALPARAPFRFVTNFHGALERTRARLQAPARELSRREEGSSWGVRGRKRVGFASPPAWRQCVHRRRGPRLRFRNVDRIPFRRQPARTAA